MGFPGELMEQQEQRDTPPKKATVSDGIFGWLTFKDLKISEIIYLNIPSYIFEYHMA